MIQFRRTHCQRLIALTFSPGSAVKNLWKIKNIPEKALQPQNRIQKKKCSFDWAFVNSPIFKIFLVPETNQRQMIQNFKTQYKLLKREIILLFKPKKKKLNLENIPEKWITQIEENKRKIAKNWSRRLSYFSCFNVSMSFAF